MLRLAIRRFFCSSSTPDYRRQIILGSLFHLNTSGFTEKSLSLSCLDIGLSSASSRLVEYGPIEIVYHLLDQFKDNAQIEFEEKLTQLMSKDEKIAEGIKIHLRSIRPYINYWDQALALLLHPATLSKNYMRMFEHANRILFAAGDDSKSVLISVILGRMVYDEA